MSHFDVNCQMICESYLDAHGVTVLFHDLPVCGTSWIPSTLHCLSQYSGRQNVCQGH